MTDEKLTPERAVRLLRAKGGEMENWVLHNAKREDGDPQIWQLTADIALIAQLLADHIELCTPIPLPLATQQRFFNADGTDTGWDGTYPPDNDVRRMDP